MHASTAARALPIAVVVAVLGSVLSAKEHAAQAGTPGGDASSPSDVKTCPDDMVEVEGNYCPNVEQRCVRWLPPQPHAAKRCSLFAAGGRCQVTPLKRHFCIDRFEFPNERGRAPVVMKSWNDAQAACSAMGKRLCGDSEWTLACEGSNRSPYPYGRKRSATACNVDHPHQAVNERALSNPKTRDAEVSRLWRGEESGARPQCESSFGVFDMTGNVDEWVVNEKGEPFKSGLKGGYWGPVRASCRPMTTAHNEDFAFYQTGFRCCADPDVRAASPGSAFADDASVKK